MIALIQIPYWWHATLFEVLWLASGLVGGAITVMNVENSRKDKPVVDSIRDDPAIHESHWRMIGLAARSRTEAQWTRLLVCVCIIVTGGQGVVQPNPLRGGTTWTGFFVTGTLVGIATLTARMSWRDYRYRQQMNELAMDRSSVLAARLRMRTNPPEETIDA